MTAVWAVLAVWTLVIAVVTFAAVHVAAGKVRQAEQVIRDCERSQHETRLPALVPDGLTEQQRAGHVCACCDLPYPDHPIGRLPDGQRVYLCVDCAAGCDEHEEEGHDHDH